MNMKQSDIVARPIAHALSAAPATCHYTLECASGDVERIVDRAYEFIGSSPLPGMADAVCYVGEGQQIDGLEPTCTVSVNLPLPAIESFHRFVTAQAQ